MTHSPYAPIQEHCPNHPVTVVFAGGPHTLLAVARLLHTNRTPVIIGTDIPPTVDDWAAAGYVTVLAADQMPAGDVGWYTSGTQIVAGDYAPASWRTWVQQQCDVTADTLHGRRASPVGDVDVLNPGHVALVGAGPGPSNSLTLGAWNALAQADAVVTDRLVPVAALAAVHRDATLVDVAKIPHGRFTAQETINNSLVAFAQQGLRVVRLKGGDPFLFGRGFEEAQACDAAGVPWRVCSGVSSAISVPAASHIPVTHRGVSQSVTIVSGHVPPGDHRSTTDWEAVARVGGTVVVLMGVANAAKIAEALRSGGMSPRTPVAACRDRGNLDRDFSQSTIDGVCAGHFAALEAPAVLVFGDVVEASASLRLTNA